MAGESDALRDWHRLFGLLLIDFFTDSPFVVEVERDLSQQQQLLDVVIVRRRRGRMAIRLPDGLDNLAAHNLISFKSLHEALDDWAMKELVGHYVAYRKLVSPSPSELLPEDRFRLHAVCSRFPHNLSGQVPWQQRQAGVYDCRWGTDVVRIIVAGELPRQVHNAPLHLFSASAALADFGSQAYQRRSANTSSVVGQLFARFQAEGFAMTYTMEDFQHDYAKKYFPQLTPKERQEAIQLLTPQQLAETIHELTAKDRQKFFQALMSEDRRELLQALMSEDRRELLQALPVEDRRELLQALPVEERLTGVPLEQIQQYLNQRTTRRPSQPRKPRRRKEK